jgi:hypothetical protein
MFDRISPHLLAPGEAAKAEHATPGVARRIVEQQYSEPAFRQPQQE